MKPSGGTWGKKEHEKEDIKALFCKLEMVSEKLNSIEKKLDSLTDKGLEERRMNEKHLYVKYGVGQWEHSLSCWCRGQDEPVPFSRAGEYKWQDRCPICGGKEVSD